MTSEYGPIERLAGASVEHGDLTGMIEAREIQHLFDVGLFRAVEHRGGDRNAVTQVAT